MISVIQRTGQVGLCRIRLVGVCRRASPHVHLQSRFLLLIRTHIHQIPNLILLRPQCMFLSV